MVGVYLRVFLWFAIAAILKWKPRSHGSSFLLVIALLVGVFDFIYGNWTGFPEQTILTLPPLFLLKYRLSYFGQ